MIASFLCHRDGPLRWTPLSGRALLCAWLLIGLTVAPAACGRVFAQSAPPISLPGQIAERLEKCWVPPQAGPSEAIEVTVRLSFSRAGAVIGEPRVTYVHSPATVGLREKIAASVLAAIKTCTPLPFTPALGAAIAGRMFSIRFRTLPDSGGRRVI